MNTIADVIMIAAGSAVQSINMTDSTKTGYFQRVLDIRKQPTVAHAWSMILKIWFVKTGMLAGEGLGSLAGPSRRDKRGYWVHRVKYGTAVGCPNFDSEFCG
ncbi:hypothetical protein C8Q70DRAFT_933244 [Cubamyces menziesii]|nr:hypothetical protein C8Q70DRAFT_933244 [Cubamyces menziesii]